MPALGSAADPSTILFSYADTAKLLGVTQRWLEDQVQRRRVPHHRLGRQVRFSASDIEEIEKDARVRAQPRPAGA
ncbi:helix-turn-helix domain-containing protein [Phycicoccus sp. M110.8]|uniref:helix-turn-helix domain-containing protein n=1 Tax=Phycicoccus sp. M110.8 TaxID=3075433 RepID=UPI003966AE0C